MEFEDSQKSPRLHEGEGLGTHFLRSLGFGEEELQALESLPVADEWDLSSLPEDLEVPGAASREGSGGRVVAVQIGGPSPAKEIRPRPVASIDAESGPGNRIEDRAGEDEAPCLVGTDEKAPFGDQDWDGGVLHLDCPVCEKELMLRAGHIGIEGVCVWCDTRIVALRDGMGGGVKVLSLGPPAVTGGKPVEVLAEEGVAESGAETLPTMTGGLPPFALAGEK